MGEKKKRFLGEKGRNRRVTGQSQNQILDLDRRQELTAANFTVAGALSRR